jgi:hypothetical protein
MWVPHAYFIDAGYRFLEDGSIVFVNNRFYELHRLLTRHVDVVGRGDGGRWHLR